MPSIVISPNLTLTCRDEQWDAIKSALFSGRKIAAIKMVRRILPQAGLADAKSYVEKIEGDLREQQSESFSATSDGNPILVRTITFLIILAITGFVIFKLLHK
ncbi:MAG TPA: hypothetical protein VGI88_03480 [Verrucomicrobiae bacterium]|jgi:hypothetical protein